MVLGAELLEIHWFCKLFGGSGSGIVENPLGFVRFFVVLGAELLEIHGFCKLFGGSGSGFVEKGVYGLGIAWGSAGTLPEARSSLGLPKP